MNAKQKVVDALTYMLSKRAELQTAENAALLLRNNTAEAERELVRVLRAVYGDRAQAGVVYQGDRYSVDFDANVLVESRMEAEVLG